jgi:hypothetical protein
MYNDVDERIKQLEERLAAQEGPATKPPKNSQRKLPVAAAIALIIAAANGGAYLYGGLDTTKQSSPTLSATSNQMGFKVYYFPGGVPAGFTLDERSISTQSGVLVFRIVNQSSGKEVVFTQQPKGAYDYEQLRGDVEFKTQGGQAFITDGQSRTTGALFTDDGTWILANAPKPIGSETMRTLLNSLQVRP